MPQARSANRERSEIVAWSKIVESQNVLKRRNPGIETRIEFIVLDTIDRGAKSPPTHSPIHTLYFFLGQFKIAAPTCTYMNIQSIGKFVDN